MKHVFFIAFFLSAFFCHSQVKKGPPAKKNTPPPVVQNDTVAEVEAPEPLRGEFAVYTKRAKKQRMKLCINLVNGDSIFNYCMNDSLLRDPEVSKILFQKQDGDTAYVLVYASAFTKDPQLPECGAGKETKLYFIRLNTQRNKAVVKQKYIESCYRTITKMSNEKIEDWDGGSPLKISYHRGSRFLDLLFDPANYKAGLQSNNDLENK